MKRGRFITFEGIDGAGKTTHIPAVADWLRQRGHQVLLTHEPGGTVLAERLRDLLLHEPMDAMSEALLVFAARRDHLIRTIEPALARGETVLCDRFTDATFAYQGAGGGLDAVLLSQLEVWVQNGRQPDLTLWFDLAATVAAARRAAARTPDRIESREVAYFERVSAGYAQRCAADPARFARLDAGQPQAAVWSQVVAALREHDWD